MGQVKEVNTQTGEITLRDFTKDELEALEAYKIKETNQLKIEKEKATAKEQALAKLKALGLTADDLQALGLGGN